MSVFRRFSTNSNNSSRSPPAAAPPSSAPRSSQSGSRLSSPPASQSTANPFPDLAGLSLGSSSSPSGSGKPAGGVAPPPPPSYGAAMRQSLDGAAGAGPQQQQQQAARAHPATGRGVQRRSSIEDRLAPLGRYDLVIMVNDSPSMVDYWEETREALMGVVESCMKYDRDGIDLLFMNNEDHKIENCTAPEVVARAFEEIQPFGSTPTGVVMDDLLRDYVERVEDAKQTRTKVKPLLLLVLTDGRADDPDMVKDIIIEFAQRLDDIRAPPYQLGIQFIQVGDDGDAAAFLQELDDELKPQLGVRDMVDHTPYSGSITPDFILKAALGAVVKSLDG
ncbi:hypothetical protein JCM10207_009162 [Rhodosporidiobolus poonsookiae]